MIHQLINLQLLATKVLKAKLISDFSSAYLEQYKEFLDNKTVGKNPTCQRFKIPQFKTQNLK